MNEIPDLPPPVLLKIVGYAHLAELIDLGIDVPIPNDRWRSYAIHCNNKLWNFAKPPLFEWCNCSSICAGEKTRHTNDLTTMTYTKTTTWRDKQLVELYAIVPLE